MRKVLFYFLVGCARMLKILRFKHQSLSLYQKALTIKGIRFGGSIRYIDFNVYMDPTAGITIGNNIVISTNVIILTHDYSYTTGLAALGERPRTDIAYVESVNIGDNVFIGAGSIILPGSDIGSNVIVGAGAVIKGKVISGSVMVGNPARKVASLESWAVRKKSALQVKNLLIDKD